MKKSGIILLAGTLFFAFLALGSAAEPTRQIIMTIGEKTATVDGKTVQIDQPPTIINGRTVLPLRFMVENVFDNSKLDYDQAEKKITLVVPDTTYYIDENTRLNDENIKLKAVNDELRKIIADCEDVQPPNIVPPIEFTKYGITLILQAVKAEKNAMRCDIKISNKSEMQVRFPASLSKEVIGNDKHLANDWDDIFSTPIPAGADRSGWVRFPLKTKTGKINFEFTIWPNDVNKYYTFTLQVDLDRAIPTALPPSKSSF